MHPSLIAIMTAVVAALASASPILERTTSYAAPNGTGAFQLEVITIDGKFGFAGNWLEPYHSGAGGNVLTLSNSQYGAQKYKYNSKYGELYADLSSQYYYLTFDAIDDFSPPAGYQYVALNIGNKPATGKNPSEPFFFTTPQNNLQFPAANSSLVFAVCPAVIYTPGVYIDTLLYRKSSAAKNASCSDVVVKAIF